MRLGDRPALADIREDIGHGLTPHAGNVAGDFGRRIHEEVAQGAGYRDILRAQRNANPLLGVIVLVDRVMAPPNAVVVPDVVVGVGMVVFHAPSSTRGVGHLLSEA